MLPAGEWTACRRHATPAQRDLVRYLDVRGALVVGKVGGEVAWPYGPNVDVASRVALLEWAEPAGWQLSRTRCRRLHWLMVGRCAVNRCSTQQGDDFGAWADHVTRWSNADSDTRVLVAQPYHVSDADQLMDIGAHASLTVTVTNDGWYGHGTRFVQIRYEGEAHA